MINKIKMIINKIKIKWIKVIIIKIWINLLNKIIKNNKCKIIYNIINHHKKINKNKHHIKYLQKHLVIYNNNFYN